MNSIFSKHHILFDDDTTRIILNFIRENIYKKYPYRSLSKSSLLQYFNMERIEENVEYLTYGNGTKLFPYKADISYDLYFKDTYITRIKYFNTTLFTTKNNKEFSEIRTRQSKKFK